MIEPTEKDMNIYLLTSEIVGCAGVLNGLVLGPPKNYAQSAMENHAIESFCFILAFLCYSDGIGLHEAGECIACFIGSVFGNDKNRFYKAAKAIDFYLRVLLKRKDKNIDFFEYSILLYNLKHPQIWTDFGNGIPLGEINLIEEVIERKKLQGFLTDYLPLKINPILKSFDK